ncbi:MAG: glutamine--tRNA ligase/YqeY domain fusion protein [Anaerolineae bacterium]|nr:glutamine--tRNA ligase/YqeY domain fusion protein [Anaerolineae bacterium]
MTDIPSSTPTHFIREAIQADLISGRYDHVHTRFPPEPNGYLHIGHAKAFSIDFGMAREFGGKCNLRFDDTNPVKEDVEYVESIQEDIHWLGFDWEDRLFYASDYFEQLYQFAVKLVKKNKAYVDDLSAEEIRVYRGTLTEPGKNSPYRNRSVEENLDLFERMRKGEFPDGARVLRAKIDMAAGNMNMRDPVMYRILHSTHHRTGDAWCIYPMYDFAHGQSDSIECITHSLCSLEYEDHRPLYNWFLDELEIYHPRQIEFGRFNLSYTVMSKRMLLKLVKDEYVHDWNDPRMPTLSGMRRRGYPPEVILRFLEAVGVPHHNNLVDIALLESMLRDDLNLHAPRVMAVLHPLKVVIDNYPVGQVEELEAVNNPEDLSAGTRKVTFSREIYIDRDDFREDPPKKYFRLAPGREVRLRYGYFITCVDVIKDPATGEVVELHCTYDPATRGGYAPDGRKVQGTLHWVSAHNAIDVEIRLYDRLFTRSDMSNLDEGADFLDYVNPDSLKIVDNCKAEHGLITATRGMRYQFEREGYFVVDPDSTSEHLVFNRIVPLRDTWAKIEEAHKNKANS